MSIVPPSIPPPTVLPTQVAQAPTVTVPAPPQGLLNAPTGLTLDATVVARLDRATVQVDTRFGPVALKTPLDLEQGGKLSLQVLSQVKGQAVLKIAALNGRPLTTAALPTTSLPAQNPLLQTGLPSQGLAGPLPTPQGLAATGSQNTGQQAQTAPVDNVAATARNPSGGIQAIVVRSAGATEASAGQTAGSATPSTANQTALPTGTTLTVRLAAVGQQGQAAPNATPSPPLPGATPLPPPSSPQGASPSPNTGAVVGSGPKAPTNTAPTAQPASPTSTAPQTTPQTQTQPPAQPTQPQTAAALNPRFSGEGVRPGFIAGGSSPTLPATLSGVLTSTGGGSALPLVQTPSGLLALQARLDLPPGTNLTLNVLSATAPGSGNPLQAAQVAGAASGSTPLSGGSGWPALSQGLDALARTDPAAAAGLRTMVPQPSPALGAAMSSFVQAVRPGGDVQKWPGEANLRALEKSGRRGAELANRLSRDVADMAGRVAEQSGDWRAMSVPFLAGGEIEAITVILRQMGGQDKTEDDESKDGDLGGKQRGGQGDDQRFLIDLDLSRLGPMQLDGVFQRKDRSLTITLRSVAPLEARMRQDIRLLFSDALRHMALSGEISFENTRAFVRPPIRTGNTTQGLGNGVIV